MSNKIPGCFKYGCGGCVTVIALFIGLIFLLSAIQFTNDTDPTPEQQQTERVLPAPPELPLEGIESDRPATVTLDSSSPLANKVGTLTLDLAMGEFKIQPGPADQPLTVEGDFDSSRFELEESWQEDEDSWNYSVTFGGQGGWLGMIMSGGGDNPHNEVVITVPRGHPLRIVGEMRMGESKIDLSGMWVESFDVEFGAGDHFIEIREPSPVLMTSFRTKSSMGQVEIRGLGDSSPLNVDVDHGMGDLFLDLQGEWRRDATIEAAFSMGSCTLWVPENTFTDIEGASVSMGESSQSLPDTSQLGEEAPRLKVKVKGKMGELEIDH